MTEFPEVPEVLESERDDWQNYRKIQIREFQRERAFFFIQNSLTSSIIFSSTDLFQIG